MRKRLFMLAAVFAAALCASASSAPEQELPQPIAAEVTSLAPGLVLCQFTYDDLFGGPQYVNMLEVDLNNPELEIGIAVCADKNRETTSGLGKRYHALAAINFGYFMMSNPSNTACGLKYNGNTASAGMVGQGSGGVIAFTGNKVAFQTPEEFKPDEYENFRASFPLLVYRGAVYDKIGNYDHTLGRHPRTAVGIGQNNLLYLVTFDGRSKEHAIGVTCPELAAYMRAIGCTDAINMDGGGSTAMWTAAGGVVNHPSDNKKFDKDGERRVYDILYVRKKTDAAPEPAPVVQPDQQQHPRIEKDPDQEVDKARKAA
ncbi:MAG: phosphodiester glycosidase family protein [Victivallaceae bacterium]